MASEVKEVSKSVDVSESESDDEVEELQKEDTGATFKDLVGTPSDGDRILSPCSSN